MNQDHPAAPDTVQHTPRDHAVAGPFIVGWIVGPQHHRIIKRRGDLSDMMIIIAARGTEEVQRFPGDRRQYITTGLDFGSDIFRGYARHIDVMKGMIAHAVAGLYFSPHEFRVLLGHFSHDKKTSHARGSVGGRRGFAGCISDAARHRRSRRSVSGGYCRGSICDSESRDLAPLDAGRAAPARFYRPRFSRASRTGRLR